MTATSAPTDVTERLDATERLEAKLDRLTEQVAVLTADAELRRAQRESFDDLRADLTRISAGAMDVATRELEALGETADLEDTVRLLRRLVETAPALERALVGLEQISALADDLAPLAPEMMALLTERLAQAEERGYFSFIRAGAGVADRIVTGFDEDDLEQLGENVVTILETIKEITQPEMLTLLGHMVEAIRAQQDRVEHEHPGDAPSLWVLARQVRDPDVRRGIARALGTLRAVSVETGPEQTSPPQTSPGHRADPEGDR
jgi:uncharacterized protein YjgD (DUF1641 family)